MPVLPAAEARFDYEVPVVVIGAGACGLTAALAAREGGAEVLVLERDEKPTGSTSLSTGMIPAAGTKLQARLGIDDTPETFAADILAKAKQKTDRDMALAIARASGPTVDWLMETHDVVLTLVEGFLYPGHSRLRMHATPHRSGRELEAALLAAAARRELDIVSGALAEDLYADADGRVRAVRFARPDGTRETVGCRTLVLACNGFGGNREMLRRHIPEIAEADYAGHVGNTGDAVRWGEALGAALADMGSYQGHGAVAHPYGNTMTWGLISGGGFQVNMAGERFSNEASGYSEQAVEVVRQPGRVAWTIFDAAREKPVLGFTDYQEVMALGGIKQGRHDRGPGAGARPARGRAGPHARRGRGPARRQRARPDHALRQRNPDRPQWWRGAGHLGPVRHLPGRGRADRRPLPQAITRKQAPHGRHPRPRSRHSGAGLRTCRAAARR